MAIAAGSGAQTFYASFARYWDARRHRIAPEVSDQLLASMVEGRGQLHAGRIVQYCENDECARMVYRRRKDGRREELLVERVINCTGPEADWRRIDNTLLSGLFAQGAGQTFFTVHGTGCRRRWLRARRERCGIAIAFRDRPGMKRRLVGDDRRPGKRQQALNLAQPILKIRREACSNEEESAEPLTFDRRAFIAAADQTF